MTEYCRLVAVALRELTPEQRIVRANMISEKDRLAVRAAYRELYGEDIQPELQTTSSLLQ